MKLWNNYWFRIMLWTLAFYLIAKALVGLFGISLWSVLFIGLIWVVWVTRSKSLRRWMYGPKAD